MARGVYYSEFGGPDVLHVGEVETLPMGPDTVRLRVAGAGINPVDWKIMRGFLAGAFEHHFPVVPGWDVAGEVLEVGPSVPELKPGDTAYGYARLDVIGHGTAAEEVVLPIRTLAKAPTTIDPVTAAAVPLAGLTAFHDFLLARHPAGRDRPGAQRGGRGRSVRRAIRPAGRSPGDRDQLAQSRAPA